MATRVQLIAEGREWIGTRWHHQAALKGVGCDCIGLVRGAAKNVGLLVDLEDRIEMQQFIGYGRAPHDGRLERFCQLAFGKPFHFSKAQTGDVLLMRFNSSPQHIAFLATHSDGNPSVIHAYVPARQVVETHLDQTLRDLIVACYSIPGVV